MKLRFLCLGLLAASISCAFSSDRAINRAAPPPFIAVQVSHVALRGVCMVENETYYLHTQPRGAGFVALSTRVVNGARVFIEASAHTEDCQDPAVKWPDRAEGHVRAVASASGATQAELTVGRPGDCSLHVDLPLLPEAGGGGVCGPVYPGRWGDCGCPEIYTDLTTR